MAARVTASFTFGPNTFHGLRQLPHIATRSLSIRQSDGEDGGGDRLNCVDKGTEYACGAAPDEHAAFEASI